MTASPNLDLVHSIYAAWERGDFSSVDWADPRIELVFVDGPSPGTWTGVAEMTDGWRGWLSAWDEWRSEPDEFRELDDARVLVLDHVRGRGKASGLDIGQMSARGAQLYHVRDAKVTRIEVYFDRDRALTDLGLAPEAGSSTSSIPSAVVGLGTERIAPALAQRTTKGAGQVAVTRCSAGSTRSGPGR